MVPTYDACVKVEDNFPKKVIGETYYHFIVGRECTKARNAAIVSFRRMLGTAKKLYQIGAVKRDLPKPAVKFLQLCDGVASALECEKRINNFLQHAMGKPPVRLPKAPTLPGDQLKKWVVDGKAGLSSAEQLKAARTRAKLVGADKKKALLVGTTKPPSNTPAGCTNEPKWEKQCSKLAKALAKAKFEDKTFDNKGHTKYSVAYGRSCYAGSLYARSCPRVCNTCPSPTPAPGAPVAPPLSDPTCKHGRRCDNAALRLAGLEGSVCVLATCGACGSEVVCDGLPGGSKGCCLKEIQDAGRSCSHKVAPCMVEHQYISALPLLDEGQEIEAKWRGTGDWLPGVVSRIQKDGSYTVQFDSGEEESEVARTQLRPAKQHALKAFKFKLPVVRTQSPTPLPPTSPAPTPPPMSPTPKPSQNYTALATKHMRQKLANELGINSDLELAKVKVVDRVHGEVEQDINDVVKKQAVLEKKEEQDRKTRSAQTKARVEKLAKVEAKQKVQRAKTEKVVKARKAAALAKKRKAKLRRKKEQDRERNMMLELRTPVEANMDGKGTWYRGVVASRDLPSITYTIRYDDGKIERNVPAASVIARGPAPPTRAPTPQITTPPPTPVPTHKFVNLNPKTTTFADDDDGTDDGVANSKGKVQQYTTINGLTTKEVEREEHVKKEQMPTASPASVDVRQNDAEEAGMQFYAQRAQRHAHRR